MNLRRLLVFGPLAILCLFGCGEESAPVSTESSALAGEGGRGPGASGAPDWSRFRGPEADGSSDVAGLPLTWSQDENIAWKTPLPGAGASSPIVWGDRVYLTSFTGYAVPGRAGGSLDDLKRHLLAIRLRDGKILWDKAIAAKQPEEASVRDHGYAANTPVADEDRVYVFLGKSGVTAFSHEGKELWNTSVGTKTSGWGTAASPILYRNLVIVNASVESGSLVALDRATGDEVWRAGGINEAWNTPVIVRSRAGRNELVVATHGKIRGFDPETGKSLWDCDTDITWYMVPSPAISDGVVYYLGGRSGVAALAVRTGGSGDVTKTHRLWTGNRGSNVSSPVYRGGYLYFMSDQRGTAYCLDADTGDLVYEQRLERAGQVYSSAVLAGDRVYYLTRNGQTFVLAAQPKFKQLAVNDLRDGGQFNGSPAVAGDRLLIRSDKFLYCIGK